MDYQSLRDLIVKLEEIGQIKHITAEVDWNVELDSFLGGRPRQAPFYQ